MFRLTYTLPIAFLIVFTINLNAQIPTIQDCLGAIIVCENSYTENIVPRGPGNYENEIFQNFGGANCGMDDDSGIWYIFTLNDDGDFGFLVTPTNPSDDYDWMLFNITNKQCSDIGTDGSLVVSCNESGCEGPTGATGASNVTSEPGGCGPSSTPFNDLVAVKAGETYALFIQNWSRSQTGYTIDFDIADIDIIGDNSPTTATIDYDYCEDPNTITLQFSKNIDCASVDINDLLIESTTDIYTFSNFNAEGCTAGGGFTNQLSFDLTTPLPPNTEFEFNLSNSGAVQLLDICGDPLIIDRTIPFSTGPSMADLELEGGILNFDNCQSVSLLICNRGGEFFSDDIEISFYTAFGETLIETINTFVELDVDECGTFKVEVIFDETLEFYIAIINDSGIPTSPIDASDLPTTDLLECDYFNNFLPFIPILQTLVIDIDIDSISYECDMATINGPEGNYEFEWSTGENTRAITVTESIEYTVTITDACDNETTVVIPIDIPPCGVEICDNGIDDDGDGLIDCLDSDCCGVTTCIDQLPDFYLESTDITFPDCQTLHLTICNDGADFNGTTSVSFYSDIPQSPTSSLYYTTEITFDVSSGDCVDVDVNSSFSELEIYYIVINDNGSIPPPLDISLELPNTTIHECDFINNLGFFIPAALSVENVDFELCDGDNYELPSGLIVDEEGTYIDTLLSVYECDSIIITNITLQQNCGEICDNGVDDDGDGFIDAFDPDCDCSLGTSTTLVDSIAILGSLCDQELTLYVDDIPDFNYRWYIDSIPLVGGVTNELILQNGQNGNYYIHIFNDDACQLLGPLEIIFSKNYNSTQLIKLCPGEERELLSGEIITSDGIYQDSLKAITGCDSIITYDATYYPDLDPQYSLDANCTSNGLSIEANPLLQDVIIDNQSYGMQLEFTDVLPGLHELVLVDTNECRYFNTFSFSGPTQDFTIETSDTNFNCTSLTTTLCYFNLESGITSISYDLYASNLSTGELQLINNQLVALNDQQACTNIILSNLNFNFNGYDQLVIVINHASILTNNSELVDFNNAFAECDNSNNIVYLDLPQVTPFALEKDTSLCANEFLIEGPSGFSNYRWSTGSSEKDLMATESGEYILTVTDDCSRTSIDTISVNLSQLDGINLLSSKTCEDTSNGTIEIESLNIPIQDLTFTWEDNLGSSSTLENLAPGNYTVTVSYNSCAEEFTTSVDAFLETPLSLISSPIICNGTSNGFVEIEDISNIQSLIFDNTEYQNQSLFENLSAGTYALITTDNNECQDTIPVTIQEQAVILTSLEMIELCSEEEWSLSNGTIITSSGTHLDTLSSITGCDSVITYEVLFFENLDPQYNISASCQTNSLSIESNPAIDEIIIDNQSYGMQLDFQDIVAGDHELTIIDSNGCEYFDTFSFSELNQDFSIDANFSNYTCGQLQFIICYNDLEPNIENVDFDIYALNSLNGDLELIERQTLLLDLQQSCFDVDIASLNFDFTGYDQITIILNSSEILTNNSQVSSLENQISECDNSNNTLFYILPLLETIELAPDVEICDTEYLIEGPDGFSNYLWSDGSSNKDLLITESGTYTLSIIDDCGRTMSDNIVVNLSQLDGISLMGMNICSGSENGAIELQSQNIPIEDLTISWDGNLGNNYFLENLPANTYSVRVSYNSCVEDFSIDIEEFPHSPLEVLSSDSICFGTNDGFVSINGSQNIVSIVFENIEYENQLLFENLSAGSYDLFVKNTNGCQDSVTINIEEYPEINAYLLDSIFLIPNEEYEFELDGVFPQNASFEWTPSETLTCSDCPNPTFIGIESSQLELLISYKNCDQTISSYVEINNENNIYFPNTFNINSGSDNSKFQIFNNQELETFSIEIFDRWGNKVHSQRGSNENIIWDGTFEGKSLNQGVYIYQIEMLFVNGETLNKQGSITLLH